MANSSRLNLSSSHRQPLIKHHWSHNRYILPKVRDYYIDHIDIPGFNQQRFKTASNPSKTYFKTSQDNRILACDWHQKSMKWPPDRLLCTVSGLVHLQMYCLLSLSNERKSNLFSWSLHWMQCNCKSCSLIACVCTSTSYKWVSELPETPDLISKLRDFQPKSPLCLSLEIVCSR